MGLPAIRVHRVDDEGVRLLALRDMPLDVCIDGRRVWTFWSLRDTRAVGPQRRNPVRTIAWPRPLLKHLDGTARIDVVESASGAVRFAGNVSLGSGTGEIVVRNAKGIDLGIDKSGNLVPTFAGRTEEDLADLLDATESALAALRSLGVEAFIAYGTLLGAVREGRVLGHDSDADLGYVSRHSDPVDVIRESFSIQRRLSEQGWSITRHSGGAFKISVTEGNMTRGLDVFGGFLDDGLLYLMGEIGAPFREEWVFPLGSVTLHGREMPAPAVPEKLLEVTYGEGWRAPDPAFQFTTPSRTVRAFNEWFRGNHPNIRHWHRQVQNNRTLPLPKRSALAALALQEARARGAEILDVGAGRGQDSLWLARQGVDVTGFDYVPSNFAQVAEIAAEEALPLTLRHLNLTDRRVTLAEGALAAHSPRPRVVLARHLLDATSYEGQQSFARFCSMALREGGVVLTEFVLRREWPDGDREPSWLVGRPTPRSVGRLLTEAGARSVETERVAGAQYPTVRLRAEW